jgi:endonuclease V-like protein UPF0215 family
VKSGVRALGIAESYTGVSPPDSDPASGEPPSETERAPPRADSVETTQTRSVLAGAVVRADRVVDGLAFETCTVGGTDATDAIQSLVGSLGREDVRYVLVAGIAPAWFNVVDVARLAAVLDRPVVSVSFEDSPGLEAALREQFAGDALAERLATYRAQPRRRSVQVNGEQVFVRAAGCDPAEATEIVREFSPEGGRPEPVRVARLAARAGRRWREE